MRRALAIVVLLGGGWAAAQEPAPPTASGAPEARAPRRRPWQPIDWFYRGIDMHRQNVGANGRKNALRDEQKQAEYPSTIGFRDPTLSDW